MTFYEECADVVQDPRRARVLCARCGYWVPLSQVEPHDPWEYGFDPSVPDRAYSHVACYDQRDCFLRAEADVRLKRRGFP